MKKLSIVLVALFMLVVTSCKSNNNVQSVSDTIPFEWSHGTDLYEDETTGAWYVEYYLGDIEDKNFIELYVYSEELLDKLIRIYYYDGVGIETINDEYCIAHVNGKYVMCANL